MKLGLLTFNMAKEWDLDTILEKCQTLGLEGVEFRTEQKHAHGVEITTTADERAQIRSKFDDAKLEVVGLSTGCKFDSPDTDELNENIARTKMHLDLCADLGGGGIKVFGNNTHVDDGIPEKDTIQQIAAALHECGDYAKNLGVLVRFEMHGDFQTAKQCNEIMRLANSDGLCLIYNCNGNDPSNGSIKNIYTAVADHVQHVHLHDLIDDFPYQELAQLLVENQYDGWCTTELPDSPDRERVLGYFVALWDAYVTAANSS